MRHVSTALVFLICCIVAGCNLAGFPPLGWSTKEEGTRDCRFEYQGDPLVGQNATVLIEAKRGSTCRVMYALKSQDYGSKTLKLSARHLTAEGASSVQLRAFDGKKTVGRATRRFESGAPSSEALIQIDLPRSYDLVVVSFVAENETRLEVKGLRVESAESNSAGQAQAQAIYVEAVGLIKTHALAYEALGPERIEAGRPASDATLWQARSAIKALLRDLGDGHSFLSSPDGVQEAERISKAEAEHATWRMLRPGIAVVHVPMFRGTDDALERVFANSIREALEKGLEAGARAWIVDLSGNRGGNMWPMLDGLSPLLGTEGVGRFRYRDGSSSAWTFKSLEGIVDVRDLRSVPVAVVTSGRTASSGEAVAVAFRGRPLTRSFGGATSGYSTSNTTYKLADGSRLYLTTAVFEDRNGNRYGGKLAPDQVVQGIGPEASIVAAGVWLEACLRDECHE